MSDPTASPVPDQVPDAVPDTGIVDPAAEPEQEQQGGAPRTDVGSAPALQERDSGGASDLLT